MLLSIEHRAAPSVDDIPIELHASDGELTLRVVDSHTENASDAASSEDNLRDRIVAAIAETGPLTPRQLRAACRVRMASVYRELRELTAAGRVVHAGDTYQLG